jgi:hypothetical protein
MYFLSLPSTAHLFYGLSFPPWLSSLILYG